MLIEQKIQELLEKRGEARLGGGQKRIDSQHAKGKMTASISVSTSNSTSATASSPVTAPSTAASSTSTLKTSPCLAVP